ncbi:MAG: inorganic diphosphatase [Myxococcales bacterium]|nr:inorganic diphosphatase [Myxococcales bacterium]MCB9625773.1 inorganic diphosphatase [Sandaracinaceae bacterium]
MPDAPLPPHATVRIEVPRGSFIKRGADGSVDFLSPVPCPFHYGSVVGVAGQDGDPQDAVVLGRGGAAGSVHQLPVRACLRFVDEGLPDDKWICSDAPLRTIDQRALIAFFRFYGLVKRVNDRLRGKRGETGYRGFTRTR